MCLAVRTYSTLYKLCNTKERGLHLRQFKTNLSGSQEAHSNYGFHGTYDTYFITEQLNLKCLHLHKWTDLSPQKIRCACINVGVIEVGIVEALKYWHSVKGSTIFSRGLSPVTVITVACSTDHLGFSIVQSNLAIHAAWCFIACSHAVVIYGVHVQGTWLHMLSTENKSIAPPHLRRSAMHEEILCGTYV